MKQQIQDLLSRALAGLVAGGGLPHDHGVTPVVERARDKAHGDFASSVALVLAKHARMQPRALADKIAHALPASELVTKVEVAGPGFINFFLSPAAYRGVVREILTAGASYGRATIGAGRPVQVEFVSANPTGPLHVGHGRGAAYGATVANLLEAAGFRVHREYYVNDAGRQMDILATSVWLRYLELCGEKFVFPANGYKGDYIYDIAATLRREGPDTQHPPPPARRPPPPPPAGGVGGGRPGRRAAGRRQGAAH